MDNLNCSIVVPTFNHLTYLKKCLASLLNLNYKNYEIIIVNDASTDKTQEYLETIYNPKISIVHHSKNLGIAQTRNSGIKKAQYKIIAFTDADCVVDKNWLNNLLYKFNNPKIDFIIGQTFYIHKNYKGYFPERLVSNINANWPMAGNIAFRKNVFDKIGFFDPYFITNEDTDLAIRAIANNLNYTRENNAIVYHQKMNWSVNSLLNSAINPSVWPILKKKYPHHYLHFKPKILFKTIINPMEYIYLLTMPILIPILLIRYLMHGKKDLKIFFTKWPILIILKRFYIYRESIKQKQLMF